MLVDPPTWRASLLGAARIDGPLGSTDRLRTRTAFAMLVYLLLHRFRAHPREELIERFWPDDDPEAARGKLRLALHSIRGTVGDVLESDRRAVRVAAPERVATDRDDLLHLFAARAGEDRLSRLAQGVALYRGPFLPGFYDEWALGERDRLETAVASALRELAVAYSQSQDWVAALEAAERLVAIEPYDQNAHLIVLQSLRALDRPEPLVRALAAVREMLSEIGSRPGDALEAFVRELPQGLAEDDRESCFLGRDAEMAQTLKLLGEHGLVTLWGPPGIGKTRLARESLRLLEAGGHRTAFVSATGIESLETLAGALRVVLSDWAEPSDDLDELADTAPATTIVIDNFESLPKGASPLLSRIRNRNPALRFLVTSQSRTGAKDECVVPLGPLDVPEAQADVTLTANSASVRLLRDRVRERGRRLKIDGTNAAAFGALCRRLEGNPLALELAAEWLDVLGPAEIVGRLDESGRRLAARFPGRDSRHLSLDSAIAASYGRLEEPFRRALRALGVFVGGWDLAAAESLLGVDVAADRLAELESRALIVVEPSAGRTRYRMLESIRMFVCEATSDEERKMDLQSLASHFLKFGPTNDASTLRFIADHREDEENVRLATETLLDSEPEAERAARSVVAFRLFWHRLGRWQFLEGILRQALRRLSEDPSPLRAALYDGLGHLLQNLDEFAASEAAYGQALAIQQVVGDADGIARAEGRLGFARWSLGDLEGALPLLRNYLAAARLRDTGTDVLYATHNLGDLLLKLGEHDEGTRLIQESLDRSVEAGVPIVTGLNCGVLGWDLLLRARLEEAEPYLRRAAEIYSMTEDRNLQISGRAQLAILLAERGQLTAAREGLHQAVELAVTVNRPFAYAELAETGAVIAHASGYEGLAARLYGAMRAWRARSATDAPLKRARLQRFEQSLRHSLGPETFAKEVLAGETASRAELVETLRGV